jgi:gamma-glutamylcyclotransferase (GGCT)/AIG2-like uncharacterized protein YtfP
MNVFCYGTLMNRTTLEAVLRRPYEGQFQDATLENHVRLEPNFYMAFEEEGSSIEGKLISDLTDIDMQRLDTYEGVSGGMYRRKMVEVVLPWDQREEMHPIEDAVVYYNGLEYRKGDYQ